MSGSLKEFLEHSGDEIIQSLLSQGLEINESNISSIAVCWAHPTDDGILYHRTTFEDFVGRPLIELFVNLTNHEEERIANEFGNENRDRSDSKESK